MEIVVRISALACGLVFGLFQTGYIVGKSKGIDLREHGSGNSGATNTLRVMGARYGFLVLGGDALKTILAMLIVYFTFGNMYPKMRILLTVYAALGCIISHDFPFYMHFKGGKGIACTAGFCICLAIFNPLFFFLTFVVFLIPFLTTHYVSLGSIMVYVAVMAEFVIFGQNGWLRYDYKQDVLIECYIIIFFLMCLAIFQHRKNIGRLVKGEESKTYLSKKKREEYKAMMAKKADNK